jgi:hypothetical protein
MSHHKKRHGAAPVPPANRPPGDTAAGNHSETHGEPGGGAPMQEQDAKRRLGGYETAGEHAIQQPSPLNDGQQHSR